MNKEVSITITLKEYEELSITKKKYEELKEVIDKAREFIEDWLFNAGGNGASMTYEDINELLDILKEVKTR